MSVLGFVFLPTSSLISPGQPRVKSLAVVPEGSGDGYGANSAKRDSAGESQRKPVLNRLNSSSFLLSPFLPFPSSFLSLNTK